MNELRTDHVMRLQVTSGIRAAKMIGKEKAAKLLADLSVPDPVLMRLFDYVPIPSWNLLEHK